MHNANYLMCVENACSNVNICRQALHIANIKLICLNDIKIHVMLLKFPFNFTVKTYLGSIHLKL